MIPSVLHVTPPPMLRVLSSTSKFILIGYTATPQMQASSLGLYYLTSRNSNARVVRLQTGQFHVWLAGNLGLLPQSEIGYLLAAPAVATALLRVCGGDLVATPVQVLQRAPAESWTYFEIVPTATLEVPEDVPTALASNRGVWGCGGRLSL